MPPIKVPPAYARSGAVFQKIHPSIRLFRLKLMNHPKLHLEDEAFVAAFEACTIPADQFSHREHVRLAWLYLREASLPETMIRFLTNLQRFAHNHGLDGLYHETITCTFLVLINERMAQQPDHDTWEAFATYNADLLTDSRALLARYYLPDTLKSDLARRIFVMPDRSKTE
jgi:hypothetical protein